jgi:hypothetical protein
MAIISKRYERRDKGRTLARVDLCRVLWYEVRADKFVDGW